MVGQQLECGRVVLSKRQEQTHKGSCSICASDEEERSTINDKHVSQKECNNWRKLVRFDMTAKEIAQNNKYSETAVADHIKGRCTHDSDSDPLTYDKRTGEWSKKA